MTAQACLPKVSVRGIRDDTALEEHALTVARILSTKAAVKRLVAGTLDGLRPRRNRRTMTGRIWAKLDVRRGSSPRTTHTKGGHARSGRRRLSLVVRQRA
jgi:hypothetical protein